MFLLSGGRAIEEATSALSPGGPDESTRFADLRELTLEGRMSDSGQSIFDLSPAEKIQLVEDLWDDLAGTPDAVPFHDWQEQELARRKANLLKNPASGLPWELVKQKARARYGR